MLDRTNETALGAAFAAAESKAKTKTKTKPAKPAYVRDSTNAPKSKKVKTALMFTPAYHGMRDPAKNKNRLRKLEGHLKAAGNRFCDDRCKPLDVSLRSDGRYAIIDGVGRHYMATVLVKPPVAELRCEVHEGLTEEDEIILYKAFLKENTKGRPLDEWLADRNIDPVVDEIMTTCETHDFEITGSRGSSKKSLTISLTTAKLAHSLDALDLTLVRVLNSKWNGAPGLTSEHIAAVAVLVGKLKANADRLTKAMNACIAADIQAQALDNAKDRGIKKPQSRHASWMIAAILIDEYNKGPMRGIEPLKLGDLIWEVDHEFKDAYDPKVPKGRR